jgi:hypothetical protein
MVTTLFVSVGYLPRSLVQVRYKEYAITYFLNARSGSGYRLLDILVAYRSGAAVQSSITVDCSGHMRGGLPPGDFPPPPLAQSSGSSLRNPPRKRAGLTFGTP